VGSLGLVRRPEELADDEDRRQQPHQGHDFDQYGALSASDDGVRRSGPQHLTDFPRQQDLGTGVLGPRWPSIPNLKLTEGRHELATVIDRSRCGLRLGRHPRQTVPHPRRAALPLRHRREGLRDLHQFIRCQPLAVGVVRAHPDHQSLGLKDQ